MVQRRGDAIGEQRRGEIVEHRTQHHLRCAGRGTLKHCNTGKALQDLIKPAFLAERPAVAVTGQSAIDEARIDGFEPRIIDAEPGRHRRTKILDQHIGRLHHAMEDSEPLGLLQIERQCPLAAIGAEKKTGFRRLGSTETGAACPLAEIRF